MKLCSHEKRTLDHQMKSLFKQEDTLRGGEQMYTKSII